MKTIIFLMLLIPSVSFAQLSGIPEQDSLLALKDHEQIKNGKSEYFLWLNYQWLCWVKAEEVVYNKYLKDYNYECYDCPAIILTVAKNDHPFYMRVGYKKIGQVKKKDPVISFQGWMDYRFSNQ